MDLKLSTISEITSWFFLVKKKAIKENRKFLFCSLLSTGLFSYLTSLILPNSSHSFLMFMLGFFTLTASGVSILFSLCFGAFFLTNCFDYLMLDEFDVDSYFKQENCIVKNVELNYSIVLNLYSSLLLFKKEELDKKTWNDLKNLNLNIMYIKEMLNEKEYGDLPQNLQKKIVEKNDDILNILKKTLSQIYNEKMYKNHIFKTILEEKTIEEKIQLLHQIHEKNKDLLKIENVSDELEKKVLLKINELNTEIKPIKKHLSL